MSGSHCYAYARPAATADCIVLRDNGTMELLLIKRGGDPYKGSWAFPGGFVDADEDLRDAAVRELEEETCLKGVPLLEIGMFGMPGRDTRGHTITAAYLAAAGKDLADTVKAADDAAEATWVSLSAPGSLPDLAFDHANILRAALRKAARGLAMGDRDIISVFTGGTIDEADLAPGMRVHTELVAGWLAAATMWERQSAERAVSCPRYIEAASAQLAEAKSECTKLNASESLPASGGGGGGF